MKVVISPCDGLSDCISAKAAKLFCERSNIPCHFMTTPDEYGKELKEISYEQAQSADSHNTRYGDWWWVFTVPTLPPTQDRKLTEAERDANAVIADTYEVKFNKERTNPILIQVVEELGQESGAAGKSLAVVEIPDNVDWYVYESDYNGEQVIEKHRIWSIRDGKTACFCAGSQG